MVYVLVILAIVLGVSLYDYFDSRDQNQLTSSAHNNLLFNKRNQKYGAFAIRKTYNRVMLIILGGIVALFGLTMGTHYSFNHGNANTLVTREITDTTLLSLEEPPKDLTTLPPSYKIQNDRGNSGQDKGDQEEKKEEKEDIPENVRDEQRQTDNPQKSQPVKPQPEKPKNTTPNDEVHAMDQHFQDVSKQARERAEARKRKEAERQKQQDKQVSAGRNTNASDAREGSSPKNMAEYELSGRNATYLPIPGFKCQQGGTVVVNVTVDSYGEVISAVISDAYKDRAQCLKEEAILYAKKTRFNSSNKATQNGTITYIFKAQ